MSRLNDTYTKQVVPKLREEFKLANTHQVPQITKVVVNVGVGRATQDKKALEYAANTLRKITGQQPIQTYSKRSIAGFKLREGAAIGLKVTLRRERMYDFLDRLISIVLPRLRDFRGLSRKAFDPQGNYSIGLKDQTVFAELTYEESTITHGLQINLVTNSADQKLNERLLELLGLPLERSI